MHTVLFLSLGSIFGYLSEGTICKFEGCLIVSEVGICNEEEGHACFYFFSFFDFFEYKFVVGIFTEEFVSLTAFEIVNSYGERDNLRTAALNVPFERTIDIEVI